MTTKKKNSKITTTITVEAELGATIKADVKTERLIGVWKKLHIGSKVIEPQLKAAREAVQSIAIGAGADVLASKYGNIPIQTSNRLSMDVLREKVIAGGYMTGEIWDALVAESKRPGEPHISAPSAWSAEIKVARAA